MNTADIMAKMIERADGNHHDINHFMKVYTFAKTIGEMEGLSAAEQQTLELAAIVHDIACPLCRIKYGNAGGKHQEAEGPALVREFFAGTGFSQEMVERIAYLVGHHHTITDVDGMDYQILLEADYLVNADEMEHTKENIQHTMEILFRTDTGIRLLKAIYKVE